LPILKPEHLGGTAEGKKHGEIGLLKKKGRRQVNDGEPPRERNLTSTMKKTMRLESEPKDVFKGLIQDLVVGGGERIEKETFRMYLFLPYANPELTLGGGEKLGGWG